MKHFKVISIHYTTKCNMKCPFCYAYKGKGEKPTSFWLKMVPYIAKLTDQVAVGGGIRLAWDYGYNEAYKIHDAWKKLKKLREFKVVKFDLLQPTEYHYYM